MGHDLSDSSVTDRYGEIPTLPSQWELRAAKHLWRGLTLSDLAHIFGLEKAGVLPASGCSRLASAILALQAAYPDQIALDPRLGDVFKNRESWLAGKIPEDFGWLAAGRARREATTVAFHLAVRRQLNELLASVRSLIQEIARQGMEHLDTLMPDYTYLHPAQPTTWAHYLTGFAFGFERDHQRIQACGARLDQSPAGGGSTNGTRLPIDRRALASMLGFDGLVSHTRDAVWQADLGIECLGALLALSINLSRLADDLLVFCTRDFQLIELSDEIQRGSAIMPQKRNPYHLCFVRGISGYIHGKLTELTMQSHTPTCQVDNRIFAYSGIPEAIEASLGSVRTMTLVLSGIRLNTEVMARKSSLHFVQATDLADALVLEARLDYATAHFVVRQAIQISGNESLFDDLPRFTRALAEVLESRPASAGRETRFAITPEWVRGIGESARIVQHRVQAGGAAPQAVRSLIEEILKKVSNAQKTCSETLQRTSSAEDALLETARFRAEGLPASPADR